MTATRVLIIGDAISRGSARDVSGALPATIRPSYRYWLWKLLREKGRDADFVGPQTAPDFPADQFEFDQDNAAYGGNTTTAVISETVRNLSADLAPHVAVLFEGTEDALAQVPIAARAANIKGQIADLRAAYTAAYGAAGSAVILVQIPPTADGENGKYRDRTQIVPYNTAISTIVDDMTTAAEPVIAVDCHSGFTAAMSDDGIKPNELGEQFVAGQIFLALNPLIGGVSPTVPTTDPTDPDPIDPAPTPTGGTPYNGPHAIPCKIEAEDFDAGGEGVGYHNTTPGNSGGAYRDTDVDIETGNGVTNVGWIKNGEWLAYTATVAKAGDYTMTARVASPNDGRSFSVLANDKLIATIAVPNTGAFETFADVAATVTLPAGTVVLKVTFSGDGQNLDYLDFTGGTPTPPVPPPITPDPGAPDYNSGTVVAEFTASKKEGSYPLTVTFTDRSTVDRKKMQRRVVVTDAALIEYATNMLQFVPADLFSLGVPTLGIDGTDWSLQDANTAGGLIHIPYPLVDTTVVISLRDMTGATWGGAGACAGGGARVSVPIPAEEYSAGEYEKTGQALLHELLHTVTGLESSDDMRTSEGFLGWLADHPSSTGAAFIKAPATYPTSNEILGLFYAYLVEKYRVHPTLNSGQVTYAWDFGDSTTSTDRSPSNTYASAGAYPVVLTVTSPWGTDASDATTITVHAPTVPPTAAFTVTATRGEVPLGVQFFDTSAGGTADRWLWDFGDGSTSELQNPTHVYTAPGVYSPSLTLSNDGGGASAYEQPNMITALRPPQPAPAIHELSRAGYLDLMSMLAEAFAWAELRDGAGLPLSPRVSTVGRISWSVDDLTMQTSLVVHILGSDVAHLQQMLSGVAFYDDQFRGEPLTVERFEGPITDWPNLTMPADTLDITVNVNVIAESVIPRVVDLTSAVTSGTVGSAMIITFRAINCTSDMVIVVGTLPAVVQAGSMARVPMRVVRSP